MLRCGWSSGRSILVEKIAELANSDGQVKSSTVRTQRFRRESGCGCWTARRGGALSAPAEAKEKEIIKEGLSELLHLRHRRHRNDSEKWMVEAGCDSFLKGKRCARSKFNMITA